MSRVVLNQPAIEALKADAGVQDALDSVGGQVADAAALLAPKDTGEGAASISHEVVVDAEGARVRVSWDPEHYYMFYQEVGTSKMSARPFLRPALDGTYNP